MKRGTEGTGRLPMAYRTLVDRSPVRGPGGLVIGDPGLDRLISEGRRVQALLDRSVPPVDMEAAPAAPARGPMALEPDYVVDAGGMRRLAGLHFREISTLEIICLRALERHKARQINEAFVSPFTWHQIAIAGDYRELFRWREGAGIKCSSLEGGRSGGGGSGLFIESFMDQGRALQELRDRIGNGVAIEAGQEGRRAGRRDIRDRELIDGVVLFDRALPAVLRGFGWSEGGRVKARAQEALRRILDRMLGQSAGNKGA